jgi:hypothetical protein
MSDSDTIEIEEEPEENIVDKATDLLKTAIDAMDEETAKTLLLAFAEACVSGIAASDVEKKYHLIGVLKELLQPSAFAELVSNQSELYGEPWERWAS